MNDQAVLVWLAERGWQASGGLYDPYAIVVWDGFEYN